MNKKIRFTSAFLTVVMLVCSLSCLSAIEVGAETANAEPIDYYTKVFNSAEEKLATMQLKVQRGVYQIWVDPYSGEVANKNTQTGQILFTNPYDIGAAGSAGSEATKNELLSQVVLKYTDNNAEKFFYSYTDAALNDQIKVKNIKNGIRVEYTLGREQTKYLVPRMISKERFEEAILNIIKESVPGGEYSFEYRKVLSYYDLKDPAEEKSDRARAQLYTDYPITREMAVYVCPNITPKELLYTETVIKTYCPLYTYEELDKDHDQTKYVDESENPPVFKLALEYTLDELGMSVRLPANGITYDENNFQLTNLTVLPYMGAGSNPNTGYTFFPDGSGALFRFEDLTGATTAITGKVYGPDYAYQTITGSNQEVVRYPVFGIVENWSGLKVVTKPIDAEDTTESSADDSATESGDDSSVGVLEEDLAPEETPTDDITSSDETTPEEPQIETYLQEVSEDRGFVAIIEEGDALAEISTYHAGKLSKYNTVKMQFYPRPKDSYNLASAISVGSNTTWTVVSSRKYVGNYKIRYIMLTDTAIAEEKGIENYFDCSWMGMAKAYQSYLTSDYGGNVLKRLTSEDVDNDIPLYIETFGAIETVEKILSIPVNTMVPLTTFDDIKTIYKDLYSVGIDNIKFKLTGFANGGMNYRMPYRLKFEKAVGGKNGFEDLLAYVDSVNETDGSNVEIFPDFDFVYINSVGSFDGVSLKQHAVKTIDNRYTSKREYSAAYQNYLSYFQLAVSPAYFSRFYEKLSSNYVKFDKDGLGKNLGISLSTLGTDLNSDFDEDEPYNREDSKEFTIRAFEYLDSVYGKIMSEGANAYTWKYIDYILNAPLKSSNYMKASNSVPFIGVLLHGYIQFAGTPINMEGDIQYSFLKAIENGSSILFTLAYRNSEKFKESDVFNKYYSVRYDIWVGEYDEDGNFQTKQLVDIYKELNGLMADLQTKIIIDHEFLNGSRVPDADELEDDNKVDDEEVTGDDEEEGYTNEEIIEIVASARSEAVANADKAKTDCEKYLAYISVKLQDITDAIAKIETLTDEEAILNEIAVVEASVEDSVNYINVIKNQMGIANKSLEGAQIAYDIFTAEDSGYAENIVNDIKEMYNSVVAAVGDAKIAHDSAMSTWETLKSEANSVFSTYAPDKIIVDKSEEDGNDEGESGITDSGEDSGFNKYAVEDGSIVAVTYGEDEDNEYRTFILNYNYFAITVVYNEITYEIEPYGYVVVNHYDLNEGEV